MADRNDPSYTVGYRKPPRATQFKPGQSGNIKGRPKGSTNLARQVQKEMSAPITITENGKRKRVSKERAIAKVLVNKAITGDMKGITILLDERRVPKEAPTPPSLIVNFVGRKKKDGTPTDQR
jgi:hypothetical protein